MRCSDSDSDCLTSPLGFLTWNNGVIGWQLRRARERRRVDSVVTTQLMD